MSFTNNLNFNNHGNHQNQNHLNHAREHRNNAPHSRNNPNHSPQQSKSIPNPQNSQSSGNCPTGWKSHGPSCFFFGDHQNYDDAEYHCGKGGGKLATITNVNSKFIISYIRTESSGNDHWIQDSRLSGSRAPQAANGKCPLIKGASVKTSFTSAICNSAYPFICEKQQILIPPAGFFGGGGGQMGGMGMNGMGGGQMGGMGQGMMSPNMNPGMNPYQNPMMGFQNPNFNTYVNQQPQQPIQPLQPTGP